jgi:hypothetical protein
MLSTVPLLSVDRQTGAIEHAQVPVETFASAVSERQYTYAWTPTYPFVVGEPPDGVEFDAAAAAASGFLAAPGGARLHRQQLLGVLLRTGSALSGDDYNAVAGDIRELQSLTVGAAFSASWLAGIGWHDRLPYLGSGGTVARTLTGSAARNRFSALVDRIRGSDDALYGAVATELSRLGWRRTLLGNAVADPPVAGDDDARMLLLPVYHAADVARTMKGLIPKTVAVAAMLLDGAYRELAGTVLDKTGTVWAVQWYVTSLARLAWLAEHPLPLLPEGVSADQERAVLVASAIAAADALGRLFEGTAFLRHTLPSVDAYDGTRLLMLYTDATMAATRVFEPTDVREETVLPPVRFGVMAAALQSVVTGLRDVRERLAGLDFVVVDDAAVVDGVVAAHTDHFNSAGPVFSPEEQQGAQWENATLMNSLLLRTRVGHLERRVTAPALGLWRRLVTADADVALEARQEALDAVAAVPGAFRDRVEMGTVEMTSVGRARLLSEMTAWLRSGFAVYRAAVTGMVDTEDRHVLEEGSTEVFTAEGVAGIVPWAAQMVDHRRLLAHAVEVQGVRAIEDGNAYGDVVFPRAVRLMSFSGLPIRELDTDALTAALTAAMAPNLDLDSFLEVADYAIEQLAVAAVKRDRQDTLTSQARLVPAVGEFPATAYPLEAVLVLDARLVAAVGASLRRSTVPDERIRLLRWYEWADMIRNDPGGVSPTYGFTPPDDAALWAGVSLVDAVAAAALVQDYVAAALDGTDGLDVPEHIATKLAVTDRLATRRLPFETMLRRDVMLYMAMMESAVFPQRVVVDDTATTSELIVAGRWMRHWEDYLSHLLGTVASSLAGDAHHATGVAAVDSFVAAGGEQWHAYLAVVYATVSQSLSRVYTLNTELVGVMKTEVAITSLLFAWSYSEWSRPPPPVPFTGGQPTAPNDAVIAVGLVVAPAHPYWPRLRGERTASLLPSSYLASADKYETTLSPQRRGQDGGGLYRFAWSIAAAHTATHAEAPVVYVFLARLVRALSPDRMGNQPSAARVRADLSEMGQTTLVRLLDQSVEDESQIRGRLRRVALSALYKLSELHHAQETDIVYNARLRVEGPSPVLARVVLGNDPVHIDVGIAQQPEWPALLDCLYPSTLRGVFRVDVYGAETRLQRWTEMQRLLLARTLFRDDLEATRRPTLAVTRVCPIYAEMWHNLPDARRALRHAAVFVLTRAIERQKAQMDILYRSVVSMSTSDPLAGIWDVPDEAPFIEAPPKTNIDVAVAALRAQFALSDDAPLSVVLDKWYLINEYRGFLTSLNALDLNLEEHKFKLDIRHYWYPSELQAFVHGMNFDVDGGIVNVVTTVLAFLEDYVATAEARVELRMGELGITKLMAEGTVLQGPALPVFPEEWAVKKLVADLAAYVRPAHYAVAGRGEAQLRIDQARLLEMLRVLLTRRATVEVSLTLPASPGWAAYDALVAAHTAGAVAPLVLLAIDAKIAGLADWWALVSGQMSMLPLVSFVDRDIRPPRPEDWEVVSRARITRATDMITQLTGLLNGGHDWMAELDDSISAAVASLIRIDELPVVSTRLPSLYTPSLYESVVAWLWPSGALEREQDPYTDPPMIGGVDYVVTLSVFSAIKILYGVVHVMELRRRGAGLRGVSDVVPVGTDSDEEEAIDGEIAFATRLDYETAVQRVAPLQLYMGMVPDDSAADERLQELLQRTTTDEDGQTVYVISGSGLELSSGLRRFRQEDGKTTAVDVRDEILHEWSLFEMSSDGVRAKLVWGLQRSPRDSLEPPHGLALPTTMAAYAQLLWEAAAAAVPVPNAGMFDPLWVYAYHPRLTELIRRELIRRGKEQQLIV